MTFQNRMALDMILAEKGGVCKMIEGTGIWCTYIPDNTGPNGKVTLAIKKLESLSVELKKNLGIDQPWDQWFGWLSGWQKTLSRIGIIILVILIFLAIIVCCVIPCVKKFVAKTADQAAPVMIHQDAEDEDYEKPFAPSSYLQIIRSFSHRDSICLPHVLPHIYKL